MTVTRSLWLTALAMVAFAANSVLNRMALEGGAGYKQREPEYPDTEVMPNRFRKTAVLDRPFRFTCHDFPPPQIKNATLAKKRTEKVDGDVWECGEVTSRLPLHWGLAGALNEVVHRERSRGINFNILVEIPLVDPVFPLLIA